MATVSLMLVSAAIIVREDGRIMITQRPEGKPSAGAWEFPGGKAQTGEDPRAALVRECQEELDCTLEVGAAYETIFVNNGAKDILLVFYLSRIVSGNPRSMEENQIAWVTPEEMGTYPIIEADKPLVERLLRERPSFRN